MEELYLDVDKGHDVDYSVTVVFHFIRGLFMEEYKERIIELVNSTEDKEFLAFIYGLIIGRCEFFSVNSDLL